jgi:RNA polymerase sigma-70 factor (ECF subfamily)
MALRFEDLIEHHHDEIFSYLWRLLRPARWALAGSEVEDVTQEVFLRAYRAFPALRPDSNHRAWLYKIATNCAFSQLRRLKRRRDETRSLRDYALCSKGRADAAPAEEPARLLRLLDELPSRQKSCVTLRYLHDLDYSEIAAILQCSEQSARANVYQALRRLRRALEDNR